MDHFYLYGGSAQENRKGLGLDRMFRGAYVFLTERFATMELLDRGNLVNVVGYQISKGNGHQKRNMILALAPREP